jgi:hypothetical protein
MVRCGFPHRLTVRGVGVSECAARIAAAEAVAVGGRVPGEDGRRF